MEMLATWSRVADGPEQRSGYIRARHVPEDAQLAGFDEAVFVEPDGRISEGGTWNLGFVDQDGTVIWPEAPVLPGTTMLLLRGLDTAKQITARVRLTDVHNMAAAFATNVPIGVRSASALDGVQFPHDQGNLPVGRGRRPRVGGRVLHRHVPDHECRLRAILCGHSVPCA
ncbi:aminotransferase class IV [Streptomyces sp. NPDC052693]|uniref:aminotransferase class IV n=1 Tax=Streptomyces sp. NPDC052693 TaxID=3155814 RepID=UPI003447DC36